MRRKKQSNFKKNMLGFFIVMIMVLGGVGIFLGNAKPKESYNGFDFVSLDGKWVTKINDKPVTFNYHPNDVFGIALSKQTIDRIKNAKMLFLTFDTDSELVSDYEIARMQLETELFTDFGVYIVTGVTENSGSYASFPRVSCLNATNTLPVIYLKEGNETKIIEAGNCLILQSENSLGVTKLKDRLLYGLYGVIDEG